MLKLILLGLCLGYVVQLQAQQKSEEPIVINLDEIENDPERVEIQRYIGYENLLSRYLTLPYDISANTGRQGRYFDIGYALLLIVPIAFLLLVYKRKRIFYGAMLIICLYLFLSFSYSFVNVNQVGPVDRSAENWEALTSGSSISVFQSILITTYNMAYVIVSPVRSAVEHFSGQSDHITYPTIFAILFLFLILVNKLFYLELKARIISIILIIFFFLWLVLSGGIIWYGFILIPVLLGFSLKTITNHRSMAAPIVTGLMSLPVLFWIVLSYSARVSNIDAYTTQENLGKSIVDPKLIYFSTGIHSAKESRNQIYGNISGAFDKINADNAFIYQIGTSTAFEIKNNVNRIYQDNILTNFFAYFKANRNEDIIRTVLKPSGFKYIIVDLYTQTLDKTPEKSLTKKYQLFLSNLYVSQDVQLLATDRVMQITTDAGRTITVNDIFAKNYGVNPEVKITNHGSYAIYEIL